ncbi:MAG: L,D-transpeptidase family protein [Anaerolineales bacterium]|nr:L,D-transpeptidase family protein [Anaerolineales bacterium]
MSNPFTSPRALKLIPLCRIFPFFVLSAWLTACAGQSAFVASDISVQAHPQLWAQAEIVKPTYTPSPTLAPTFTPSPTASPTSAPEIIYAEIVPDTPTPEYAAQQTYPQQQSPPAVASYGGNKYILISISEQHLYAYEGDTLVYSFVASTGMNNATRAGSFSVLDKIPSAYGATWNIWMPNWLGIYWAGSMENGIHALPILPNGAQLWAGFLGSPISYGCIVLGAYEAQMLYDWAELGTPVEIRW